MKRQPLLMLLAMMFLTLGASAQLFKPRWSIGVDAMKGTWRWAVNYNGTVLAMQKDSNTILLVRGGDGYILDTVRYRERHPLQSFGFYRSTLYAMTGRPYDSIRVWRSSGTELEPMAISWPGLQVSRSHVTYTSAQLQNVGGDHRLYITVQYSSAPVFAGEGAYLDVGSVLAVRHDGSGADVVVPDFLSNSKWQWTSDQRVVVGRYAKFQYVRYTRQSMKERTPHYLRVVGRSDYPPSDDDGPAAVDMRDHVVDEGSLLRLVDGQQRPAGHGTVLGALAPPATVLSVRTVGNQRILSSVDLGTGTSIDVGTLPGTGRVHAWFGIPQRTVFLYDEAQQRLYNYEVEIPARPPVLRSIVSDTARRTFEPLTISVETELGDGGVSPTLHVGDTTVTLDRAIVVARYRPMVAGTYDVRVSYDSTRLDRADTTLGTCVVTDPIGPMTNGWLFDRAVGTCRWDRHGSLILTRQRQSYEERLGITRYTTPIGSTLRPIVPDTTVFVRGFAERNGDDSTLFHTDYSDWPRHVWSFLTSTGMRVDTWQQKAELSGWGGIGLTSAETPPQYTQSILRYHRPRGVWFAAVQYSAGPSWPGGVRDALVLVDGMTRSRFYNDSASGSRFFRTRVLDVAVDDSDTILAVRPNIISVYHIDSVLPSVSIPADTTGPFRSAIRCGPTTIVTNAGIHSAYAEWAITHRFPWSDVLQVERIPGSSDVILLRDNADSAALVVDGRTGSVLAALGGTSGRPTAMALAPSGDTVAIGTSIGSLALYRLQRYTSAEPEHERKNHTSADISIGPQPATTSVAVRCSGVRNWTWILVDNMGIRHATGTLDADGYAYISLSVPAGRYHVILTDDGSVIRAPVVVVR